MSSLAAEIYPTDLVSAWFYHPLSYIITISHEHTPSNYRTNSCTFCHIHQACHKKSATLENGRPQNFCIGGMVAKPRAMTKIALFQHAKADLANFRRFCKTQFKGINHIWAPFVRAIFQDILDKNSICRHHFKTAVVGEGQLSSPACPSSGS